MNHPRFNLRLTLCLATTAIALLSAVSQAHAAADCAQVEVQNLRPGQGALMLAAFTDAASFGKAAAVSLQMPVGAETMTVKVCNLSGDMVAFTLFQDLNSNGKLDRNPLGIPSEPWGASGKTSAFSGPAWETSQVPLDGATIVVKMSK